MKLSRTIRALESWANSADERQSRKATTTRVTWTLRADIVSSLSLYLIRTLKLGQSCLFVRPDGLWTALLQQPPRSLAGDVHDPIVVGDALQCGRNHLQLSKLAVLFQPFHALQIAIQPKLVEAQVEVALLRKFQGRGNPLKDPDQLVHLLIVGIIEARVVLLFSVAVG